jgi:hypothetical protein
MYRVQAKTATKQSNNGTRKIFRGGADSENQSGSASSESLPVDQSITIETTPMPEFGEPSSGATQAVDQSVPSQETGVGATPAVDQSIPSNEIVAPQANEIVAPPAEPSNEIVAPQANEIVAPPAEANQAVDQSIPSNGFEAPPDSPSQSELFGEQPVIATVTGEGESAEIEAFRNMMGTSPEAQQVYLYMNTNISTEENRDKSYKREGVLHFTDSVSVGANQNTIMSLGSVIGNRGIETTTYDKLRNIALQKVGIILGETRRCYNTKIGFERNGETILVHIYGTVYSKKTEQPTI